MNVLQSGAAWLMAQLKSAAGVSITYARGDSQSDPITAVVSQHDYEVVDEKSGLMTSVTMYDWTIAAADLVLNGSPITPWKSDSITGSLGAFQVLPIGKRPCYEWLDTSGLLLTVHTKKL
jgi:hypothetical protein